MRSQWMFLDNKYNLMDVGAVVCHAQQQRGWLEQACVANASTDTHTAHYYTDTHEITCYLGTSIEIAYCIST